MLTADNPARGRGVRSRGIAGQGSRSPDPLAKTKVTCEIDKSDEKVLR